MEIRIILLWVCIIFFASPALFFGFQKVKQNPEITDNFTRWGYPRVFMVILGATEIITAIGLFFSQTRQYAIYIYGLILIGAILTHIKAREIKELVAPVCVLGLLIGIYYLNTQVTQ